MNNAEYEQLITKAPLHPVEVQRPNKDAELASYRKAEHIEEPPMEFSFMEILNGKFQAAVNVTKFLGAMTPHFINISWSWMMGNSAKLATAIAALIVAALSYFNILIPESLLPYITSGVALLIGWLIPAPQAKPKGGE
jgi:hypothetical protein